MLNKIHNNVQSMLTEARTIVNHHSPKSRHQRAPSSVASFQKESWLQRSRANTHLRTQNLRNRSETQPEVTINAANPFYRQLQSLRPDQSQLLSTKIYGFHKCKDNRSLQQQALPKLKTNKNLFLGLSNRQHRKGLSQRQIDLFPQPTMLIKTIQSWNYQWTPNLARKIGPVCRSKTQSQRKAKKKLKIKPVYEDLTLQPWQSQQQEYPNS